MNSDKSPADGVSFPYVNLGLEMHTSAEEKLLVRQTNVSWYLLMAGNLFLINWYGQIYANLPQSTSVFIYSKTGQSDYWSINKQLTLRKMSLKTAFMVVQLISWPLHDLTGLRLQGIDQSNTSFAEMICFAYQVLGFWQDYIYIYNTEITWNIAIQ